MKGARVCLCGLLEDYAKFHHKSLWKSFALCAGAGRVQPAAAVYRALRKGLRSYRRLSVSGAERAAGKAYDGGEFTSIKFQGECCDEEIGRIGAIAREQNGCVFVGVGGGKTLDTAKLCADAMNMPLIIVPSSASTDAPVSEIAVIYTPDGEYIGSRKVKRTRTLCLWTVK